MVKCGVCHRSWPCKQDHRMFGIKYGEFINYIVLLFTEIKGLVCTLSSLAPLCVCCLNNSKSSNCFSFRCFFLSFVRVWIYLHLRGFMKELLPSSHRSSSVCLRWHLRIQMSNCLLFFEAHDRICVLFKTAVSLCLPMLGKVIVQFSIGAILMEM